MKRVLLVLFCCLIGDLYAGKKEPELSAQEAVDIVEGRRAVSLQGGNLPAGGGVYSASEYRLFRLSYAGGYVYQKADSAVWKAYLKNPDHSLYGRFCAAGFLLGESDDARALIEEYLSSENLRYRYNAATIVVNFSRDAVPWSVETMIDVVADGRMDGTNVGSMAVSFRFRGDDLDKEFPEGDRLDIGLRPTGDLCWALGCLNATNAVPAIMTAVRRDANCDQAVRALGMLGATQAVPLLVEVLESDQDKNESEYIETLGMLHAKEAVPWLVQRLGTKESEENDSYTGEPRKILNALLAIQDKRAVDPIRKYMQSTQSDVLHNHARRVLIQLTSDDPVPELMTLFDELASAEEREYVMRDLTQYNQPEVVRKLGAIASQSDCAREREYAIRWIGEMGGPAALVALSELLKCEFPKDLKTDRWWKRAHFRTIPEFYDELIREEMARIQ